MVGSELPENYVCLSAVMGLLCTYFCQCCGVAFLGMTHPCDSLSGMKLVDYFAIFILTGDATYDCVNS